MTAATGCLHTLQEYLAHIECTREEFAARYPHPFLIRHTLDDSPAPKAAGFNTATYDTVAVADTIRQLQKLAAKGQELSDDVRNYWVAPLIKRPGNAFMSRISIGRTRQSDITFEHAGISKLHAYFTHNGNQFFITDCNSTNGTSIDGAPIEPGRPFPVSYGTMVAFGDFQVTFEEAGRVLELLRACIV